MHSEDGKPPNEIELIRAADLSKTTKRMISSEWGIPVTEKSVSFPLYHLTSPLLLFNA